MRRRVRARLDTLLADPASGPEQLGDRLRAATDFGVAASTQLASVPPLVQAVISELDRRLVVAEAAAAPMDRESDADRRARTVRPALAQPDLVLSESETLVMGVGAGGPGEVPGWPVVALGVAARGRAQCRPAPARGGSAVGGPVAGW